MSLKGLEEICDCVYISLVHFNLRIKRGLESQCFTYRRTKNTCHKTFYQVYQSTAVDPVKAGDLAEEV